MFHVEQFQGDCSTWNILAVLLENGDYPLFSNAEAAEDGAEHLLGIDLAGQPA